MVKRGKEEIKAEDVGALEDVIQLEVEIPVKVEPAKVVLSPEFIAAKRRDLAIEVAKKLGGLK